MKKINVAVFFLFIAGGLSWLVYQSQNGIPGIQKSLNRATGLATGWFSSDADRGLNLGDEILKLIDVREELHQSGEDMSGYRLGLDSLVAKASEHFSEDVLYQLEDLIDEEIVADDQEGLDEALSVKILAMYILVQMPLDQTADSLAAIIEDRPLDLQSSYAQPQVYLNDLALKRMAIKALITSDAESLLNLLAAGDAPGINQDVRRSIIEYYIATDDQPLEAIQELKTRVQPSLFYVLEDYQSYYAGSL